MDEESAGGPTLLIRPNHRASTTSSFHVEALVGLPRRRTASSAACWTRRSSYARGPAWSCARARAGAGLHLARPRRRTSPWCRRHLVTLTVTPSFPSSAAVSVHRIVSPTSPRRSPGQEMSSGSLTDLLFEQALRDGVLEASSARTVGVESPPHPARAAERDGGDRTSREMFTTR